MNGVFSLVSTVVLIDTWWNVNSDLQYYNVRKIRVLIDTWWNVNLDGYRGEDCLILGFNRYMVECEFFLMYGTPKMAKEF